MKFFCKILFLFILITLIIYPGELFALEGYVELRALHFPNKADTSEMRGRIFLEHKYQIRENCQFYTSGYFEDLVSNRSLDEYAARIAADDIYLMLYLSNIDIKMGYSKVTWGKLDEVTIVDIFNPINAGRFFLTFERKQAKLPLPLISTKSYVGDLSSIDFVFVPYFREPVYDTLNEKSSPFNTLNLPLDSRTKTPAQNFSNAEYGIRFSNTYNELDWSLYYAKFFDDNTAYTLNILPVPNITGKYIQSEMIGADCETTLGKWGLRAETAFFNNSVFWKKDGVDYAQAEYISTGIGLDRNFSDNYINLSTLYRKILIDDMLREPKDELSLIGRIQRKFSYDTKKIELSGVYNLKDESSFARGMYSVSFFENFWVDFIVGIFYGKGTGTLSSFKKSDFVSLNATYNF
ncbi:MAG: DUF1302 family protein [Candidatus Omnitrophota bacterium]